MYSTVFSAIAITLTLINLYLLYTHNKKSLKPYLLINTDIDTNKSFFEIYFINKGVGPAIITDFKFKYRGEKIDASDYNNLVQSLDSMAKQIAIEKGISDLDIFRSIRQIENDRVVLAPNERLKFIRVESEHYDLLKELMANIDINCQYKSIYDQEETVNYISGIR